MTVRIPIYYNFILNKMNTLPPIVEDPLEENVPQETQLKADAFDKQIIKHNRAKTHQVLNLIYSILVGVLSGVLAKRHFKHAKTVGVLVSLGSFIIGRQASQLSLE